MGKTIRKKVKVKSNWGTTCTPLWVVYADDICGVINELATIGLMKDEMRNTLICEINKRKWQLHVPGWTIIKGG